MKDEKYEAIISFRVTQLEEGSVCESSVEGYASLIHAGVLLILDKLAEEAGTTVQTYLEFFKELNEKTRTNMYYAGVESSKDDSVYFESVLATIEECCKYN